MKKRFLTYCFLLVVFVSHTIAQSNWTPIGSELPKAAQVELVSSNIQENIIHLSLDGFKQVPLETPRGTAMKISVQGGVQLFETGMPDLSKVVRSIIIPDLDAMQLTILDAKYTEFENIEIAPSKGHFNRNIRPEDVLFVYGDAYTTDAFWPGQLASLEDPFIMRDFRGQSISFYPFQYNPVTKTLRVYTDIVVEVKSTGKEGLEPLVRKSEEIRIEREFGRVYERFFLNMQQASKSYPMLEGEEGSLLIIAFDAFMEAMQPFVDWKRTIGRRTEIVPKSVAGANATAIKNFVASYYAENDDFAYLLLVGDGPQIPPMSTSNGHSDNAYGFLVGSNSYNDIFVGRFSAETVAHVETQVQRMIEYERDLDESDTWLSTGIGIARNEGTGSGHHGENDYVHMDFVRDTLLNYTYDVVHRNYDGNVPGVPNTTAAQISANINAGASTINFCNHGSVTGWSVAGYNINHVNQLTNIGKLPYIQSVACVNGNFVNNFCFAEAWMRATHNGQPTGAVGIMAATINQPWQPPMCGQDEMVSIKTEASIPHGSTIKRTYGGISINGSMFMIPQYGTQGIRTHETWILFGDPTLMVRTAAPQPFQPDYNPVALIGWSSFTVSGLDDGAVVAFTVPNGEGEVEILGTATAANGVATVVFDQPLSEPAMATLAITGFNKITYINEEISVIPPEGPYVLLSSFDIAGETYYNETISFNLELENVGIHTAEDLVVILSSDDEYVHILEGTYNWGDLQEYTSEARTGLFQVHIDKNIPDQHKPVFELTFMDAAEDLWYGTMNFTASAPNYEILSVIVDDEATGNNNGTLDPGEIAHLHITVKNTGHAGITELMASGTPQTDNLVFLDEYVTVGDLETGEEKTVVITVMGSHLSLPETTEIFTLDLFKTDYLNENEISLVVGILPVYLMGQDNFVMSCFGKFYDSGGPDGNYSANDDHLVTFYPAHPGNQLHFVFDAFHIEESNNCQGDFLRIYDGPNTSWPLIGTYCGENSPGAFTSSNSQGAVTFRFKSNTSNTFPGWEARFYCTDPPLVFENISAYPQDICEGSQAQLSAMSTGGGDHLSFLWSPAESLDNPNIPTPVASPAETTEYTLELSDGETTISETITIYVHPYPSVSLGDTIYASIYEPVILDAGNGDLEYLWSDGSTGQYLTVNYHDYMSSVVNISVVVTNPYGCSDEDEVVIIFEEGDVFMVSFIVTDEFDQPVTDAVITLGTDTNEAGDYVFMVHEPGNYSYTVSRTCMLTAVGEALIEDDKEIDVQLNELVGDANGDGQVNILDVITIVNYFTGVEDEVACFDNADANNDGVINILDIIIITNIFSDSKDLRFAMLTSETAGLRTDGSGISLQSDGTLAGLQFELQGTALGDLKMELVSSDHEIVYNYTNGRIKAMIFSMNNTPLPEGDVRIVNFNKHIQDIQWIEAMAGNLIAEEVPLMLYHEVTTDLTEHHEPVFKLYPNPVRSTLHVESNETIRQIRIIDLNGQLIQSYPVNNRSIELNVSELFTGLYFVEIFTDTGVTTRRVHIIR
ncbi:MAG: C25 family cysteine peptidase [Bacteroidales bacterium]|nr:C25 family cysteine peptidase [Bacteroidales bacterium]